MIVDPDIFLIAERGGEAVGVAGPLPDLNEALVGLDGRLFPFGLFKLLRRMKREDITTHGFRSTFSDWAAERTAYPREVVEMALAHAVANRVEAAYRRGDLFGKRRELMRDWAVFCS